MPTPLNESRPPAGRTASIIQATAAVGSVMCIAWAAFGSGDDYDTRLYLLALILASVWAFLFLTGKRKRRIDGED